MFKKISQKYLEKKLDGWLNIINQRDEVLLGRNYLEFWESQGYDVERHKEELELVRALIFSPQKIDYKKNKQN